jgi:hypothetical protein
MTNEDDAEEIVIMEDKRGEVRTIKEIETQVK